MNASLQSASESAVNDHSPIDVLIVGAGLSGIGAAKHLQMHSPQASWCILESRDAIGGTWDLFRYPGIRSDSDMYTLGYSFKPWVDHKSIADGSTIRQYIQKTADENGITPHIRHGHSVTHATWSTDEACWTITVLASQVKLRSEKSGGHWQWCYSRHLGARNGQDGSACDHAAALPYLCRLKASRGQLLFDFAKVLASEMGLSIYTR